MSGRSFQGRSFAAAHATASGLTTGFDTQSISEPFKTQSLSSYAINNCPAPTLHVALPWSARELGIR